MAYLKARADQLQAVKGSVTSCRGTPRSEIRIPSAPASTARNPAPSSSPATGGHDTGSGEFVDGEVARAGGGDEFGEFATDQDLAEGVEAVAEAFGAGGDVHVVEGGVWCDL